MGSFPRASITFDPPLPEVAALGRSNVGKSSLLNALAGRRIARVSATPGKTRALNVYNMGGRYYFLDLPGYGYAKASKIERAGFRGLVTDTLDRARVVGVLWLLDVRREPSAEDLAMQDLLAARGTRVLAAVTKSDKLPRGERDRAARELPRRLSLDQDQVVVTSARTGEGIGDLRVAIEALVRDAVV